MFIARFALGFGIGPKSATVPIYAAETTPPPIRGALVMQWQMWVSFISPLTRFPLPLFAFELMLKFHRLLSESWWVMPPI